MKKTDLTTFREELLATGGYKTPADRKAATRHKPSGLITTRFSFAVSRVFPMCAVYEALGRLNTDKWAEFCFSTVTMPESLGMNVELEGWQDRAAYKGPVVYLCNHMSTYETILLPPVLLTYGPFNVVAKASLAHLPFLGKAAAHMGLVGIGRKNPKADLLALFDIGSKRIAEGSSFLIFPQGTRQAVFERRHFSSIGAKLAEKAGVPIVPLAIDSRCMPTREKGLLSKVFKDFGTVDTSYDIRLAAGPVIPCGKSRDMHEACFDWIAGKLESWGMPTNRDK
ncbi:MAG: 1-acyl-sn-glycerol-3-phosphate acyltransferase [Kiritimatiellae bacterium]|nr:1-acyl-sn-glycerol-3-phosphate acyltransferase [Kiritimatiellia bacterium]